MAINGIHHVALKVSDFKKALKFYTEGLGFKYLTGWGEGDRRICMLDAGGGNKIELFAGGEDAPGVGRYIHLAFKSDDPDADYARALELGAVSWRPPYDASAGNMNMRLAFVYGPGGEMLEFFREK